ncbi:MAG TPA: CocE/NonD family hydrolase [Solirubrobacterales bacterium]|nr:CocE/NonD family hydrolase [Solirubrobacterales bacterium]
MRPTSRWFLCGLATAVAVLLSLAPAALAATGAGPPKDYTRTQGLSQPIFKQGEIRRNALTVPMADGERLYIEVIRPRAQGSYPVILEASPYHGTLADRDGTRILPEPRDEEGNSLGLTGYFAPRGYAVVMVDLRGTGRSQGCLDHIGQKDASDLERIVEWAASRPWSNGRVGMTGHSYVGSTPSAAAAQRPEGLKTIVPSAGLASMYHHQFQAGVPYFLQWVGPMEAYEQLAIERKLPGGDDFGNNMEETGCGLPQSSLTAGEEQLSGAYSAWHAERDHEEGAMRAPIPIFLVHGVNDDAARVSAAEWFTRRGELGLGASDKLWLGQWDHGSGCCPNRRGIQWTFALHAWFDKWLAGRTVNTGPPVEIFMSDGSFEEARAGDRDEVYTAKRWPESPRQLELYPRADGALADARPSRAGQVTFQGDPTGFDDPQATGGATFSTRPLTEDLVIAGQPELDLVSSTTAPRVHLIANLYDQYQGDRRRISQFAINPELRHGLATPQPATPGERYTLDPPGFAMGHHLRAGHRLVLRVTTSDPDKVPTFAVDPEVNVFTGPEGTAVRLPVVDGAVLYPDTVPLQLTDEPTPVGPAQPTIRASTETRAPGAGERVAEVTSTFVEFDVEEGFDNATTKVLAEWPLPGDIDLFLQRKNDDGSWTGDLSSGASGSLENEQMQLGEPIQPGHYRIEVHNWAGPPANPVDLTITFFNQNGEPGPDG